jgi:putative transposase
MDNHVHLIIDPGMDAASLGATMKRLAGRHARRMNLRNRWRGSLWESRFKCSPIQTERYLLACGRYIDLNPVRARVVERPESFVWSSYRARAGLTNCDWLDVDPATVALSNVRELSQRKYRELVCSILTDEELTLIRGALHRNQLTGDSAFCERIEDETGVRVSTRTRGRPRRDPETEQAPLGARLREK